MDEEGHLHLKAGMAAEFLIIEQKLVDVVEDAYSLDRELEVTMEQLELPAVLDSPAENSWAEGPGNAEPLRGEAACAACLRNREKGILEKCSERLRDASTEAGEAALSQVVLRFAGRVDILDLTPCWKGSCWEWGQWLVE